MVTWRVRAERLASEGLDAHRGDPRVHADTWTFTVPRDHV